LIASISGNRRRFGAPLQPFSLEQLSLVKGFVKKSNAPARIARTLTGTLA
jgi:hypothetical protein